MGGSGPLLDSIASTRFVVSHSKEYEQWSDFPPSLPPSRARLAFGPRSLSPCLPPSIPLSPLSVPSHHPFLEYHMDMRIPITGLRYIPRETNPLLEKGPWKVPGLGGAFVHLAFGLVDAHDASLDDQAPGCPYPPPAVRLVSGSG